MAQKVIEVAISPTGEAVVQTKGYAGSDCLQASRFLEQPPGVAVNEVKTAEFYAAAVTEQQAQQ